MLTKRASLLALAVLAPLAGWAASSFGQPAGGTAEASPTPGATTGTGGRALPVEVVVVERSERFERRRTYTGELRAARAVDVGFQVAGRVERLHVRAGDEVRAGDVLVELDTRRTEARRAELEARKAQAAARLAEMEAGTRAEVLDAARARVRAEEAEVELAGVRLDRREQLVETNAVAREEVDAAAFGAAALEARLAATRAQLAELEAGERAEVVAAQRALVEQFDAQLASLDIELADAHLRAPFDGRVATRAVDEGAVVAVGDPALRLVESARLEAWVGLPPETARALAGGPAPVLRVDGRRVEATLDRVLPELDPTTRTVGAILRLAPDAPLEPGRVARLEVLETEEVPGVWLPLDALSEGTRGLWSCYVVEEDAAGEPRVRRVDVEVLHGADRGVYVRGMLEAGDRVVVSSPGRVVPGQVVAPVEGGPVSRTDAAAPGPDLED